MSPTSLPATLYPDIEMFAPAYNGIDAAVLPKHHVILVTEGTTSRGDFENRRTEWVADQRV